MTTSDDFRFIHWPKLIRARQWLDQSRSYRIQLGRSCA